MAFNCQKLSQILGCAFKARDFWINSHQGSCYVKFEHIEHMQIHKAIALSICCVKQKKKKKRNTQSKSTLSTPMQFYREVIFDPREHNNQLPQAIQRY